MNLQFLNNPLSRSAKIMLGLGVAGVLVLTLSLSSARMQNRLDASVENARMEYVATGALIDKYESLKQGAGSRKSSLLQEPLFSYVEKVTRKLDLASRIDYVRPDNRTGDNGETIQVVQVSFKGITLNEFVGFLYHIEVQKKEIFIRNIAIKKDGRKNLNVQMALQKRS